MLYKHVTDGLSFQNKLLNAVLFWFFFKKKTKPRHYGEDVHALGHPSAQPILPLNKITLIFQSIPERD